MDSGSEQLTLAFSLAAVKRLAAPEDVFADATTWSQNVGVVSREPRAAHQYVREHDLRQDFFTGERSIGESLALIKRQFATDRYVFLGTTAGDRSLADSTGWEYYSIEEGAAKAGWDVSTSEGPVGRLSRILRRFR